MTIGSPEVLAVWAVASTVGSALFWSVLLLGRLTSRLERVEQRAEDLDKRMDRAGDKMSDLADSVQKMLYGGAK